MTNRKTQNSVLFLTTLGVYLGLVLVGATPQVLAQAATTRNFDITDEIGQVENLDNDPGNGHQDAHSVARKIRRSVSAFLADFSHVDLCETTSDTPEPRPASFVSRGVDNSAIPPFARRLNSVLSPQHLARASI